MEEEEVMVEEEATEEDPAVAGGKILRSLVCVLLCLSIRAPLFVLVFVTPLLSCILIEQHILSTVLCKRLNDGPRAVSVHSFAARFDRR